MKYILALLLLVSAIPEASVFIPKTKEEITTYLQVAEDNLESTIKKISSLSEAEQTFENTIAPLNRLNLDLLETFSILTFVSTKEAADAIESLKSYVYNALSTNPKFFLATTAYCKNALLSKKMLSPYERFEIQNLLQSCPPIDGLKQLMALNAKHPMEPFIYRQGAAAEKQGGKGFTILNLNTCFLPGNQTYCFGGMTPWKYRIDGLAQKVLEQDADIICLQEVYGEEAGDVLYGHLKDKYAHFYYSVGPCMLSFSIQTLGLPSGLFVASKYPIESPRFTPFTLSAFQMNYGFFDFVTPVGHIYTTHLQSLNYDQFPEIRAKQLSEILAKVDKDFSSSVPTIVCGDLNIPFGHGEPGEALLKSRFKNNFNKKHTYTYYFEELLFSPKPETKFQVLDYALLDKRNTAYTLKTRLVPMNSIADPANALSDHHALFSKVENQSTK